MKLYTHYEMTSHTHVSKNGKAVRTRSQSDSRRLRARLNNTVERNRKGK